MSAKTNNKRIDSLETVEFLASRFLEHANLLSTFPKKYDVERLDETFFLPWSIASNSKAMHLLSKNSFGNEVYVVLRALLRKSSLFIICKHVQRKSLKTT